MREFGSTNIEPNKETMKRTHYAVTFVASKLEGCADRRWVARRRITEALFVDLRDRTGIVQVVFDPIIDKASHQF